MRPLATLLGWLVIASTAMAEINVYYAPSPLVVGPAAYEVGYYGDYGYSGPVYVGPYVRTDGTYVESHYRSAPDGVFYNNWSSWPNVNPYTGQWGYRRWPSQHQPLGPRSTWQFRQP